MPKPMSKATYMTRSWDPAAASFATAAAVAALACLLSVSTVFAPVGWRPDEPFRYDLAILVSELSRNVAYSYSRGESWFIARDLGTTWQDIVWAYHLEDEVFWRVVASGAAMLLAGAIAARSAFARTRATDCRWHHAGRRLMRIPGGAHVARLFLREEIERHGPGIELTPGVTLSRMRELRNVLLIGAPNSGKTRILLFLIEQVLHRLLENPRANRLLLHDTTGEILRGLPAPTAMVAAFHPHRPGGWAWKMGRDIRSVADAMAVAKRLVSSVDAGAAITGSSKKGRLRC